MNDSGKGKRPRIKPVVLTPIVDPIAYEENLCSPNARRIKGFDETLNIHFWIDKHYSIRDQHGDDDGKREDIGIEFIEPLIQKSFSHLLFYSSKHKNFSFVNHNNSNSVRKIRITLKDSSEDKPTLNTIVEYNYASHNNYEVTVKTAMRKEGFTNSNGDFIVAFEGNTSSLIRNDRGNYLVIDTYEE